MRIIGLHDACSFKDDNVKNMPRKVPGTIHAAMGKDSDGGAVQAATGKTVIQEPSIP